MHQIEIENIIDNFWHRYLKMVPDEQRAQIDQWLNQGEISEYSSPSEMNPIPAKHFVCHLDTGFMEPILADAYPKYEIISHRLPPRTRFLAYFALSRSESLKKAYRSLNDEDFFRMGFDTVPNYELLRVFVYEKIRRDRLKTIFEMIIQEIVRLARKYGIMIGQRVGEDATDIHALKHDPEAEYCGYYEEYGYKVDIVHDLDQETFPLEYTPISLTADEGKCLPLSDIRLRRYGIKPKEWKVDGKYATYANIAHLETKGTHLVYRIQNAWVMNPKGTPEAIQRRYQRYHRRDDFKVTRDLNDMLVYLANQGDLERVGAYYRNQAMIAYANDPEGYLASCNERSGKTEGLIGTTKVQTLLDSRLPQRGWNAFRFICDLCMISYAFAVLIRLQHGDTARLGNLTYIC
jgi:hypothetical protein